MKIFVVLNEKMPRDASDVHNAFDYIKSKQIIDDYTIYSYIYELKKKSTESIIEEICNSVLKNDCKIVLWMHPQSLNLNNNDLKKLENLKKHKIIFGLWDGDIFGRFIKHIPKTLLQVGTIADATFVQGLGYFSKKMKKNGSKYVEFVPAVGDTGRFDGANNKKVYKYDIVLIGNNYQRRFSLMDMKGAKLRRRIVKLFSDEFGDRFAVFGMGWGKYTSNKGILDYNKQQDIYHHSKIAIGTNNPSAKYYFSDRLPISMLCGKPVVYNYEKGLDVLFKDTAVYLFKDEYDALDKTKKLLLKSEDEFEMFKLVNREFAKSNLVMELLIEYMITYLLSIFNNSQKPANPWIDSQ